MIQGRVRADDSPAGFFRPRNSYNRQCHRNVSFIFYCDYMHCVIVVVHALCRLLPLTIIEMKKLQLI